MATKAQIAKRFKDGYYSPKKASKQEIRKAEALLENIFNASAKFLGKPDFKTASEYAKHLFKNKDKDEVFEGAVEATIISFKSQQTCYSKGIRSKSAGLRRTSREEMYALGRQIQYLRDAYLTPPNSNQVDSLIKKDAQELYDKFYEATPAVLNPRQLAKDLACIHIDEIISKGYNLTDIPNKALNEIVNGTDYYNKLKQAIQNL